MNFQNSDLEFKRLQKELDRERRREIKRAGAIKGLITSNRIIDRSQKTQKRPKSGKCILCNAFFSSQGKLNFHFREVHSPHLCNVCGREYTTLRAFRGHLNHKHGLTPGEYRKYLPDPRFFD